MGTVSGWFPELLSTDVSPGTREKCAVASGTSLSLTHLESPPHRVFSSQDMQFSFAPSAFCTASVAPKTQSGDALGAQSRVSSSFPFDLNGPSLQEGSGWEMRTEEKRSKTTRRAWHRAFPAAAVADTRVGRWLNLVVLHRDLSRT